MEAHTGRLVEIHMYDNINIEQYLEHIYTQEKGIADLNYCDDWTMYATQEAGEYIVHDDKLYKIKNHMSMVDGDNSLVVRAKDDSIHFTVQFYNGSTCFDEEVTDALDKLKKEEDK
jgi:hypothetical protein